MRRLSLPPRIKVFEALGCIADGRVRMVERGGVIKAKVISSTGERSYKVVISLGDRRSYSDDNGTLLRGYVGYPIVAVLMVTGVLPYDRRMSEALKGIKWKKLNERYKRYAIVEWIIKKMAERRGVRKEELDRFADGVMDALRNLGLQFDGSLA